ncbi:hypothetical protein AKJ16_DCAP03567 [Drosera capensis]
MVVLTAPCPSNSVLYNETLCACSPGFIFNVSTGSCVQFTVSDSEWVLNSGVDYSIGFPVSLFQFDQIKKFTQSQAVFLEATACFVIIWLVFCGAVRFGKLGDGRTPWFNIRWLISRLDISFATSHYLDDQKVVLKRKTELGGAFSMASWILFIGLVAVLIYQIISKRSVEVHSVRAANAPDLVAFVNNLEFNITTISSMSCTQLRGLGTLAMGNPGSIDYRTASLSTFANYSCLNSSRGPIITLTCNNCPLSWDNIYINWQFVDIPNEPAAAVSFQFNLTARNPACKKHMSFFSGIVNNGSRQDDKTVTYRGPGMNILKFNVVLRIYHNFHDLKLVQPLLHEFLPGSYVTDAVQLQSSLQNPANGFINNSLSVKFLSDYIVEVDHDSFVGLVGFLANVGGLYCVCMGIFYFLLIQCEHRSKRLRHEDQVLRRIRQRRKAQERWDKLRKYVMYTWGCRSLQEGLDYDDQKSCCAGGLPVPVKRHASLRRRMQQEINLHTISFDKNGRSSNEKVLQGPSAPGTDNHPIGNTVLFQPSEARNDDILPLPPKPELRGDSRMDVADVQKSIQDLYEYNASLREKLIATQSMLDTLMKNTVSSSAADAKR